MRDVSARHVSAEWVVWAVALALLVAVPCVMAGASSTMRRMGGGDYPQAFIWWTTANRAVQNAGSEAEADRLLSQLDGVASPCLHLGYFAGFKRRHPDQFVFLFCQGHDFSEKPTVYDPVDRSRFYPGHWVHCEAAPLVADVPAESGESDIRVDNVGRFRLVGTRGHNQPDDICLVARDDEGSPDWSHCEQVRLVAIRKERSAIRVRRGGYGTKPLAFKAGKALAAAHASEPWGYEGGASWVINYSARCPRDAEGRSASDVLLDVLAPLFAPNGAVHNFDGLTFDVSPFRPRGMLVGGRLQRTGWLGRPLGPFQRLALETPNLMQGTPPTRYLKGQHVTVQQDEAGVRVRSRAVDHANALAFRLVDVPCRKGEDLLIRLRLSASPRPGWPEAVPRRLTVRPVGGAYGLLATFVGSEPFTSTFYFRDMPGERATLQLQIEGRQDVTLHVAEAYTHADAGFRQFERGLVLANPGDEPGTFDLAARWPDARYERLQGSSRQDTTTNNGQPVGPTVTLGPRDGLFLLRVGDDAKRGREDAPE